MIWWQGTGSHGTDSRAVHAAAWICCQALCCPRPHSRLVACQETEKWVRAIFLSEIYILSPKFKEALCLLQWWEASCNYLSFTLKGMLQKTTLKLHLCERSLILMGFLSYHLMSMYLTRASQVLATFCSAPISTMPPV